MIKKIAVIGAGYVGSSLGILLAPHYEVLLIDKDHNKVNKINNKQAPFDEPLLSEDHAEFQVIHDLTYFKATPDIILGNRMDEELLDVQAKVFTRDIYGKN